MYIHHNLKTDTHTPYKSMRDVYNGTGITVGSLKYHFCIKKEKDGTRHTEWKTKDFKITRTEMVTEKKKPRGASAKWGFE